MNKSSTTRTSLIIIVVVLALVLTYFYFEGGSKPTSSSLLESVQSGAGLVGSTELALLTQIQSLRIDTSFFSDPAFQSLLDYSIEIPEEGRTRPNPFAPYPGDNTDLADIKTERR